MKTTGPYTPFIGQTLVGFNGSMVVITLMRPVHAILLDMDGTLVDSKVAVETIWSDWARANGLGEDDVLAYCHGRDVGSTVRRFLPELEDSKIRQMITQQLDRECSLAQGVKAAPGARDLVDWMSRARIPWAVVTNAPRRLADFRLGVAGLRPSLVVSFEDVEHGKPDPEGFRLAASRLGTDPAHSLGVEDSESGLAAARAAGTMTVAVGGRADADIVCVDLAELLSLLSAEGQR